MESINYTVVVPVYNAERSLIPLTKRIWAVFTHLQHAWEIIFVDDGSQDCSWQVLTKIAAFDGRIKLIKLAGNFGQHNATLCGMRHASGDFIITIDDDLQQRPEDIPKLIETMRETGCDVVITRFLEKKHVWYRNIASTIVRKINEKIGNAPQDIYLTSFRLIKKETAAKIAATKAAYPYFPSLIFSVTRNVMNVLICHQERPVGKSNYTLYKLVKQAGRIFLNNPPLCHFLPVKGKSPYIIEKKVNF